MAIRFFVVVCLCFSQDLVWGKKKTKKNLKSLSLIHDYYIQHMHILGRYNILLFIILFFHTLLLNFCCFFFQCFVFLTRGRNRTVPH